MKHLHPGLGVGRIFMQYIHKGKFTISSIDIYILIICLYQNAELPERSYGSDCRMYVPENPTNRFINIQV